MAKNYLNAQGRNVKQFSNNFPSCEWAMSFVLHHKDEITFRTCQNLKRTRASVSHEQITEYFKHLEETLKDGQQIPPQNIFNYDETNLCDDPGTKKCIFKRGVKYAERIKDSSKSSISVMFCGSAAGQMIPSYVVYKAENLWTTWTEGGPKGTRYNRSHSGWVDACCFTDWFESTFLPHVKQLTGRKVLIGDNLSSHFTETVLRLANQNNIAFSHQIQLT